MKILYISLSNIMTFRNLFYTGFLTELKRTFKIILLVESNLYDFLNECNMFETGCEFKRISFNNCLLYKVSYKIYRIRNLIYVAQNLSRSKSKKSLYQNDFGIRNKFFVKLIYLLKISRIGMFITELILKFILPKLNKEKVDSSNLLLTLPQSFFDNCICNSYKNSKYKISFIFSWDNVTSREPILIKPDFFILWNKIIAAEVEYYYKFHESKIFVTGVLQNDLLQKMKMENHNYRLELIQKYKLDHKKRIVLYTTGETKYLTFEPQLVKEILLCMNRMNYQLIIRLHPLDSLSNYSDPVFKDIPLVLPSEEKIYYKYNNEWVFSKSDLELYYKLLLGADLVLNIASTVALEAVSVKTPVININFIPDVINCNHEDIHQWYESDHYSKIVEFNVIPIVESLTELEDKIKKIFTTNYTLYENKNYEKFMCDFFTGKGYLRVIEKTVEKIVEIIKYD